MFSMAMPASGIPNAKSSLDSSMEKMSLDPEMVASRPILAATSWGAASRIKSWSMKPLT